MKLRTRLVIAFLTITLVPVILIAMTVTILGNFQMKSIEREYGINGTEDVFTGNSMQMFNKLTQKTQAELKTVLETQPEKINDLEYLNKINAELGARYSFLLIRRGEEFIYSGSPETEENQQALFSQLPAYGNFKASANNGLYLGGDTQHLVKQMDFSFVDGEKGSLFIVTIVDNFIPEVKHMLTEMLMATIMILIFVGLVLTSWVYRAILRPLSKLQEATHKIKEGNLDFALDVQEDDEIGQLCMDFEEMRQRLKENAEEKIQYDKESKELISNISHDLKTPITAIKGYVEGIMDGVASSPEKLDKYIRTIYNKANDMDRLIDELTFYSKIDTNKIPYTFTKINVARYFRDCVEEVGLDMESRNIELGYFNYVDEDVVIIADAEQMKKVINNIVGNSVKYLDKKKGIINIRIKDVGDFIQVEIEDNGRGIATKDLPYIFDRFYRTDSSRNSSQGGSGIGLSIVRKIIEDHGGKIWATSKEGIGTEIHFVLRKYQEVIQE